MQNYKAFFLTADKNLEWTNKEFSTDAEAIADAVSKLKAGETVKVYCEDGRVVLDTEANGRPRTNYEPIRINCYARVLATGTVGKVGAIYRQDADYRLRGIHCRRTFGLDWGGEYAWDEIERISPKEYHATAESLKLSETNRMLD